MKASISKCIETVNHRVIVVEENGRKAVFKNGEKGEFHRIRIDGCVVKSGKKCDYLIVKNGSGSVLVELKGKDIEHACEQLFASADNSVVKGLIKGSLGFLIVSSRYPKFDTYVLRAKTTAAKKYKAGLRIVNNIGEFVIEDLIKIAD